MKILEVKDPKEIFKTTIEKVFEPVEQEHGWRVIIDGLWCQKKANANTIRVYRSLNSAKDRIEQEFYSYFRSKFYIEFAKEWNKAVHEEESQLDFYKMDRKAFRKYMNQLYKEGLVRYEEI
jgi:hypothetical protein